MNRGHPDTEARNGLFALLAVDVCLAVAHIVTQWPLWASTPPHVGALFHLDREANIPTYFSAGQLALLAWAVGKAEPTLGRLAARVGATVVLFLAVDEATGLHEWIGSQFGILVRSSDSPWARIARSFPSYYWLLLYALPTIVIVALATRRMWYSLDRRQSGLLGLGIFLFGAAACDYLEGRYGSSGHGALQLALVGQHWHIDIVLIEELCEMVGVTLMVYAFWRPQPRPNSSPYAGSPAKRGASPTL